MSLYWNTPSGYVKILILQAYSKITNLPSSYPPLYSSHHHGIRNGDIAMELLFVIYNKLIQTRMREKVFMSCLQLQFGFPKLFQVPRLPTSNLTLACWISSTQPLVASVFNKLGTSLTSLHHSSPHCLNQIQITSRLLLYFSYKKLLCIHK